jgi:hypothetical protein
MTRIPIDPDCSAEAMSWLALIAFNTSRLKQREAQDGQREG